MYAKTVLLLEELSYAGKNSKYYLSERRADEIMGACMSLHIDAIRNLSLCCPATM